jgi:hypothetical protein
VTCFLRVSGEAPSTLGCENDTFGVESQTRRVRLQESFPR